jgi:hypothetical protein
MALRKEQEHLCRELGDKQGLQGTLGNQGVILQARRDMDGAMVLHKEQERLCRELGNRRDLSISLGNQALIFSARGDMDGAMALHKEQERLCREMGTPADLERSRLNQATILAAQDNPAQSRRLAQEASHPDNQHGLTERVPEFAAPLRRTLAQGLAMIFLPLAMLAGGVVLCVLVPWGWLIGLPAAVVGLTVLAIWPVILTGAITAVKCPSCGGNAMRFRAGRIYCPKCASAG